MSGNTAQTPGEQPSGKVSTLPWDQGMGSAGPADAVELINAANASNEAVEDQYARARRASDTYRRSADGATQKRDEADKAKQTHRTVQAEHPQRHAPLLRQRLIALVTIALDGLACYFAAQALDGSQTATLGWAALFLAVLAGGELGLDHYAGNRPVFRTLAIALAIFVGGLGLLRLSYLATTGSGGMAPALVGAALFTGATAGFLLVGYRALRAAETTEAAKARRKARGAAREAAAAQARATRDKAERDRLADAYLSTIRPRLLKVCPTTDQQHALEQQVRAHLRGTDLQ